MAEPTNLHDDFCPKSRFRFADCTCGGDVGESCAQIVRDASDRFAEEMKRIHQQQWARNHGFGRAALARQGGRNDE